MQGLKINDCQLQRCTPMLLILTNFLRAPYSYPEVRTCQGTPATFLPLLGVTLFASAFALACVPSFARTLAVRASEAESRERRRCEAARATHDLVDVTLFGPICIGIMGSWACLCSAWALSVAMLAWAIFDIGYIIAMPHSIPPGRLAIELAHHCVMIAFLLVPLHHPELAHFTAIAGSVELDTFLLRLCRMLERRAAVPPGAISLLRTAHHACFVLVRLVGIPIFFIAVCTRSKLPAAESAVVIVCQTMLCTYNFGLWFKRSRFRRRLAA
ncbi:hypothetical protein T492DRAFT_1052671 [Pavlovales sp. CCMP2436]|nr:hypothetical protein T492DRAFT_1052671 [Pavlovales sp. CCMP2436]